MRSSSTPLPAIEELLLQRDEMLLLDEILDFSAEHIEARVELAENHPLAGDSPGMPAWVGIELMAQAVSAFSAFELRRRNLPPRIGLLLGARSYEARMPFFPFGTPLQVRADLLMRDTSGLGVFDCAIYNADELLARAQVKGYMPDNIEEFLQTDSHG